MSASIEKSSHRRGTLFLAAYAVTYLALLAWWAVMRSLLGDGSQLATVLVGMGAPTGLAVAGWVLARYLRAAGTMQ